MAFSGALKLTDLNDFITPSQACVKPVESSHISSKAKVKGSSGEIRIDDEGAYYEGQMKLQKANITLNDCLACSGCVTSAETVLIEMQSQEELLRILSENIDVSNDIALMKLIVVSVSPQSVASLAGKYKLSLDTSWRRLSGFFKSLGVHHVLDTSFGRDISLTEQATEFLKRYRESSCVLTEEKLTKKILPLLTSACPGWVCYAEKTHGSTVLPYISTVKSPQQVMGSLVKGWLPSSPFAVLKDKAPDKVYHVAIMPCYDKKLEASRPDFFDEKANVRDVDCVIATLEVERLLEDKQFDFAHDSSLDFSYPCDSFLSSDSEVIPFRHAGSGSGGYAEYVFKVAAKELFARDISSPLEFKTLRNKDFREVALEIDGQVKLRFATAYGFRNIQNLVQKIKRGKCTYDFVEVMACPAGCVNGGGQLRPDVPLDPITGNTVVGGDKERATALLDSTVSAYNEANIIEVGKNPVLENAIEDLLDRKGGKKELHTTYHEVEKFVNALTITW